MTKLKITPMNINHLQRLFFILTLFIASNFLFSQEAYSRDNFPSKEDIFTQIKGSNEKETLLKQASAFIFLWEDVNAVFSRDKSPKEKKLLNDYREGMKDVRDRYDKTIASLDNKANQREYFVKTNPIDKELKSFIINNLFDEKTRKNYLKEKDDLKKFQNVQAQKMKESKEAFDANADYYKKKNEAQTEEKILNFFLFIIGLVLASNMLILDYFYGKRIFNRKKQINDSYNSMVVKSYGKAIITIISIGVMLLGILLIGGTFHKVFG